MAEGEIGRLAVHSRGGQANDASVSIITCLRFHTFALPLHLSLFPSLSPFPRLHSEKMHEVTGGINEHMLGQNALLMSQ